MNSTAVRLIILVHDCVLTALLQLFLQVYSQTTMADFRQKSRLLTGYMEMLIHHYYDKEAALRDNRPYVNIISPTDPDWRGCQLSLQFSVPVLPLAVELHKRGVAVRNTRRRLHSKHRTLMHYVVL